MSRAQAGGGGKVEEMSELPAANPAWLNVSGHKHGLEQHSSPPPADLGQVTEEQGHPRWCFLGCMLLGSQIGRH